MPSQDSLIFKLPFGESELYLILLLEVQSDQYKGIVALRVLEYVVLIAKKLSEIEGKKQELPVIFPIVLHTGNRPFTRPTSLKDLWAAHPKILSPYIPQFEYYLVDEFANRAKAKVHSDPASILIQANQTETFEDYEKTLQNIKILSEDENFQDMIRQILKWLYKVSKRKLPDLLIDEEYLEHKDLKGGLIMLEQNFEKMKRHEFEKGYLFGEEKGIAKGIERGEVEGTLKTLLLLYKNGLLAQEATKLQMRALLNNGYDDLVQLYLEKFNKP